MSRDWILREQGSRDWRMLPIAIVMWAASLGAHALFAWRMSDGLGTGQAKADAGAGIDVTIIGMEWPVTRILPITVASCAAVAAMIVVSFRLRIRWTGTLTVCVAVALSLFAGERYDLIVLDIMLPKIDGYGVCELIRKQSDVPIIMLTALSGEEDQIKGLDLQECVGEFYRRLDSLSSCNHCMCQYRWCVYMDRNYKRGIRCT